MKYFRIYCIFILALSLFACQSNSSATIEIIEPVVELDADNGLRGHVTFETNLPSQATVMLKSGDHEVEIPAETLPTTHHKFHLLGLHAETTYQVIIQVTYESGGQTTNNDFTLSTKALPDDFPPIDVTINKPRHTQTGITLFNIFRWTPKRDGQWGYLIGVDKVGKVVWYQKADCIVNFVGVSRQDTLLYLCRGGNAIEMSMHGEIVYEWTPTLFSPVIRRFHHELIELTNGHIVAIGGKNETHAQRLIQWC